MINSLSDYKFEVLLEQITPYVNDIDLKWDKRNEIFRTTEFKPRFDKFLVEKLKIQDSSKLLIPRENLKNKNLDEERVKALNYKVMLEKVKDTDYKIRKPLTAFQTSGKAYYVRPEGGKFKLIFFSLNKDLLKVLKDNLAEFLAVTNFGKRQSKCYGSFYIAKEDENYKDIDTIEKLKEFKFFKTDNSYIEFKKDKGNDFFKGLKNNIDNINLIRKENERNKNYLLLRELTTEEYNKKNKKNKKNPSLAIMKILKKNEDTYRLYIIPNFEVISAWYKKQKTNIEIYNKSDITFDLEKFKKYINENVYR